MIILAAVGVVAIMKLLKRLLAARIIVAIFLLAVATDLGLQAFMASAVSFSDPDNPYVYVQPTDNVLKIAERIEQVSQAYPTGRQMPIFVVCPDGDYWPMPWYLRSFENVGWWEDVNEISSPAPVVIASPALESRLITRLFDISPPGQKNLYVPLFDTYIELRPGVELRGYVTKDLSDKYRQQNPGR
jgi:predicted membrane-bound mannosyltransferase